MMPILLNTPLSPPTHEVMARQNLIATNTDKVTDTMCKSQSDPNLQSSSKYSTAQLAHIKPSDFVRSCFNAYGINSNEMDASTKENYFLKITEERMDAYDLDITQAIRREDFDFLKSVKKQGRSLSACNAFGESIVHLACRRGSSDLVKYLVEEGDVSLRVSDDFGRTPLHDACWRTEPNFEMIDIILDIEPDLLFVTDKRGHLPFDYARRHHWGLWIQFLEGRVKKEIRNRLNI